MLYGLFSCDECRTRDRVPLPDGGPILPGWLDSWLSQWRFVHRRAAPGCRASVRASVEGVPTTLVVLLGDEDRARALDT